MELLSKEQEAKEVMIAKHNSEIVAVAEELYEWIGGDNRAVLEEVLFHWLSNYDGDMDERSSAIFKTRRLIEFTETLAKIEKAKDEIKERVN